MPTGRTLAEWLSYQQETLHPRSIDLGLERVRAVADRLGPAAAGGAHSRYCWLAPTARARRRHTAGGELAQAHGFAHRAVHLAAPAALPRTHPRGRRGAVTDAAAVRRLRTDRGGARALNR